MLSVVATAERGEDSDVVKIVKALWQWVTHIKEWNSVEGWLARIAVCVALFFGILWLVKRALEMFVQLSDAWKSAGFPTRMSREDRIEVRRRQQFANVLQSDLATIAKA